MSLSFSIPVPVGAWHDLLPACLESLARQRADVRVALLDASGDARVAALADRYGRLFAHRRHGPDKGQSDAIREGWEKAPGDVLGWLNADDALMPDALEQAAARFAAEPDVDIVCGHSLILDGDGAMTGYHFAVEPPGPRLLEAGIISQPSCFFRRGAYERAGGLDPSLHYVMDWELWIRMFKAGARFSFIDAPLSMVMWGAATKTASFNRRRRAELDRVIRAHAPAEKQAGIFRAFAIHTLTEQIRPATLKTSVLRRLRRAGPVLFGLGADGRLHDGAVLHLAHYGAAPKTVVALALDGPAGRVVALEADGDRLESRVEGDSLRAAFRAPVEAGRAVSLTLRLGDGAPLYLKRCVWT